MTLLFKQYPAAYLAEEQSQHRRRGDSACADLKQRQLHETDDVSVLWAFRHLANRLAGYRLSNKG